MAKKRKAAGQPFGQKRARASEDRSSKLKINTFEDVADSEDEFHLGRDKILLDEGPEAKRRRKWQEQDEFLQPSDEEVLAYSTPSEDELEEDDAEMEDGDARSSARQQVESDASAAEEEEEEDEDEDIGGWGPSKRDYYDADKIETEQDALDEEAEALRLQKKQLQGMTEADFGFDEAAWREAGQTAAGAEDDEEAEDVVTEVLPQLRITEEMGPAERLKLLKTRYPEFEPLAKEFLELEPLHKELVVVASNSKGNGAHTVLVKYRALAAYMAAISMYFAILTTATEVDGSGRIAKSPLELRDHPVMDSLVKCRQLWEKVKDLPVPDADEETVDGETRSATEREPVAAPLPVVNGSTDSAVAAPRPRKTKKTKAQRAAEALQAEASARRLARMRKTEEELASLSALTSQPARRKPQKPTPTQPTGFAAADDASDFGDEAPLTAAEAAEKARRRKTLRFYTSQIAQKALKRGTAGRDAGGDADIPYRERLKDRIARLNAEAEKRGKRQGGGGEDLGGESDEEDRWQARELREGGGEDKDYYEMVAARGTQRKKDKEALAAAKIEAQRAGGQVVETETVGPDGKRKISYVIEKNKGLTPHRKKEVRNPRVKKRMRFEEKKKKLGSVRQVYKGGEGRGGYGGELTGIKKGLVRGVKL